MIADEDLERPEVGLANVNSDLQGRRRKRLTAER
jgi:hypothetical protein